MSQNVEWHIPQPIFANILSNLPLSGDVADLRDRVIGVNSIDFASSLLEEIAFRIEICLDTQCKEDQYSYYLLRSYCKLCLQQYEEAIQTAMYSTDGFRLCGNIWAQVFGHWFLGAVYASQRRGYLYLAEIKHALDLLEGIRQNSLIKGEYDVVGRCQVLITQLLENKEAALKMGTGPLYMPGKAVPMTPPATYTPGYLLLPWIPQYQSVRAGNLGNLAAEPTNGNVAIVRAVEIENVAYNLYPIHGTSTTDRQITLADHEKYGFALVVGHSMNACSPPICDGDYVLFHLNVPVMDKDIVIASRPTDSADYSFMVKRYHHAEKALRSESHDMQEKYPAIKLSADHQILGVVIAVAKKE